MQNPGRPRRWGSSVGPFAAVVFFVHLLGACGFAVSYDDTAFRCDQEPQCPDGFECIEGFCQKPFLGQVDAGEPDSSSRIDAMPASDATLPSVDATLPPVDAAPVIQTLSFGENTDDDITGVTADTYIEDLDTEGNFGASVVLKMDGEPYEVSLLRFDISAIPAGSEVLEARLVVWTRSGDALQVGSIQVFEMLESWAEGGRNGGIGVANYTQRETTTPWTTPGAGPGSRDIVILADFVPDTTDTEWDTALAIGPVQSWVDTSVNYGLALATSEGTPRGVEFHSSESSQNLRRPRLVVTFRAPAQ